MVHSFDPGRAFATSLRQARLVAFVCAFVAPATYLASFASQVLHGNWHLYFTSAGPLPWDDPRLTGALALSLGAMALAFLLPPRLGRRVDGKLPLSVLRGRNLVVCALLVAAAAAGLFLGTRIGPPAANLCLSLFLAPMAVGVALFPTEKRWRAELAR
jgi:hypothetical protein